MAKDQTMKAILASIEAKEAEVARLQAQIEALREVYNQEAGIVPERARAARSDVKTTVLDMLRERGRSGLNAQIACDLARQRGKDLHTKSVSSLLSRLKGDGTVRRNGDVYILTDILAEPKDEDHHPVVRPIRTSGQMS